ncbi:ABC transporter ATP-binding protein [Achromobacter ruhlandii]|uniref:ABC transporter ATP-binding protein n=1 Tax=Achromobacter ruhlandii TaxID=72557 RepID=UPI0006C3D7D4|nr:ABC transporter ATP-binding protein [Achromobacter ruhlandii]AVC42415.1 ABC transporter ATP-binding protein [Achromobacter xylosoxidans]CUI58227.1 Iron(3+)-hydroxamate import ATP-binding protein FhuC [Achromobacter ruhlandii]CUI78960.1 Iron(3+)-hydroxamate import ATP-binding protein FhuC [Achromobacter ruhlandii]CUJ91368.1 Iron(3+)-hydroxamate import ATP-binding protein FhuC [Achromobacter ruhlandii]
MTGATRAPALAIDGISAGYGGTDVLHDLSLPRLGAGEVTALLGPNGSGKSTLLKALAGLVKVRAGLARLNDLELARMDFATRARHLVYLPQSLPAAVHLRVFESVLVAARASEAEGPPTDLHGIDRLLERLGIGHLALSYLDALSGGQKQLVGLAQALVRRPRVLLLDEPLSALDLNYQFHVMRLLKQETADHGLITVIVLHDLNVALQHADRAVMIHGGRLVAAGAPADVITPASLAAVYGVRGRVEACSRGRLQVLIDDLEADPR